LSQKRRKFNRPIEIDLSKFSLRLAPIRSWD
jgi:hypothetical protein